MKKLSIVALSFAILAWSPAMILAADGAPAEAAAKTSPSGSMGDVGMGLTRLGAGIGAGIAVIGGGLAMGRIGAASQDAIARQPEAAGQMFGPMIINAAMAEAGMLFAIVLCLLLGGGMLGK